MQSQAHTIATVGEFAYVLTMQIHLHLHVHLQLTC